MLEDDENRKYKWWKFYRPLKNEPTALWCSYWISFILMVMCLAISYTIVNKSGLNCSERILPIYEKAIKKCPETVVDKRKITEPHLRIPDFDRCIKQNKHRKEKMEQILTNLCLAHNRLTYILNEEFEKPSGKYYQDPWQDLDNIREYIKRLQKNLSSFQIKTFKETPWWEALIFWFLIPAIVVIFVNRFLLINGAKFVLCDRHEDLAWRRPYIVISLIVFGIALLSRACTDLSVKKVWFGWSSFCILPNAAIAHRFAELFLSFIVASPLCIGWCLTRENLVPTINLDATDGRCGVGKYVSFLKIWSVFPLIVVGLFIAFGIEYSKVYISDFPICYLFYGGGAAGALFFIIARGLRNGYNIRAQYIEKVEVKRKEAVQENRELPKLPDDPMAELLGKTWWILPATITGAVITIWKALDWLGILAFIVGSSR